MGRFLPIIKLILIVAVGLFLLKIATKAIANKFPNSITSTLDNVVQTV
ncbi:hypothetical protein [Alicyclobacillus acidoterrestris]|uniref:Uncharacterized protein n=1 Tax=Alicyclobacillus acidoterrestris (strain ATCC 49025 / DSM 3922 / CIP 106132 / NCIMB 13137 / GD3B) TaxID=1356854 RepID=T0D242_ALIAG|nr:hypothetical protein [Alicyclobacillus acidoterrestris]EPZ43836.1 hypothetical protein N007_12015 [Alicyclobacillus acidoterrestris ATCC 49025]UNO49032.1 hypothetical protein K1I37_00195 [Alicyclobacillus acidoterrestris]